MNTKRNTAAIYVRRSAADGLGEVVSEAATTLSKCPSA